MSPTGSISLSSLNVESLDFLTPRVPVEKKSSSNFLNETFQNALFSDHETQHSKFLIEDVNLFGKEDLEEISYKLCILKDEEKEKFLKQLNKIYIDSYHKSLPISLEIHEEFSILFTYGKDILINENTKKITTSYDAFKFACKLLAKEFPGLYGLPTTSEHEKLITQLLKNILIGDREFHEEDPYCFEIQDLSISLKMNDDSRSLLYFDHIIQDMILSNMLDPNTECCLEDFIKIVVTKFINIISEKKISIEFENGEIFWDGSNNDFIEFLKIFKIKCLGFLKSYEAENIIDKSNIFIKSLKEFIPNKDFECEDQTKLIESLFSLIPTFQKDILEYTEITLDEVQDLIYNENVVQNWIRLKIIEFMILSCKQHYKVFLEKSFDEFYIKDQMNKIKIQENTSTINPLIINLTHQKWVLNDALFFYKHITSYEIASNTKILERMGIGTSCNCQRKAIKIELESDIPRNSIDFFYLFKMKKPSMDNIKINFHWQVISKLIKFVASKFNENIIKNSQHEKLSNLLSDLKKFDILYENSEISFDTNNRLSITNPYCFLSWFSTSQDNIQEINEKAEKSLLNFFYYSERIYDYFNKKLSFRKINLLKCNDLAFEFRKLFENALEKLKLKKAIDYSKNEKITNFFEKLPKLHISKYEFLNQRSYYESLKGSFMESENPLEIDWKINRYINELTQLYKKSYESFECIFSNEEREKILFAIASSSLNYEYKHLQKAFDLFGLIFSWKDGFHGQNVSQDKLLNFRKIFKYNFVIPLRDVLTELSQYQIENDFEQKIKLYLFEICKILFSDINFFDVSMQLNRKMDEMGSLISGNSLVFNNNDFNNKSLISDVKRLYNSYRNAPRSVKIPLLNQYAQSAMGQTQYFDPLYEGNFPEHLGTFKIFNENEKEIKFLAFGSPTSCGEISKEFVAWMSWNKLNSQKHLFVVNQDMRYPSLVNYEEQRVQSILRVGENEFKDVLYCVVLSKNSDFYYQQGEYQNASHAVDFKRNLLEQHFDVPPHLSGNLITQSIQDKIPNIKHFCSLLLDQIHHRLFYNKEELTNAERQIFLDVFHDFLVLKIVEDLKVDSFNISCKDAIDRAADSVSRLWAHVGIVKDMEKIRNFVNYFLAFLLTRAMKVRKRPIIHERADRCIQAVHFYENHKRRLKQIHGALFLGTSFVPIL